MTRRPKDPLRLLTDEAHFLLTQISRAPSEPARHGARAKIGRSVAAGQSDPAAARSAGRRSGAAIAQLVARVNHEGVLAIEPRHGGGRTTQDGVRERERILEELQRSPNRAPEGTASWSLSTLRPTLRSAAAGLPHGSPFTIWVGLREANWSWQQRRSWCRTGTVSRNRKDGLVDVTDPATVAKKPCLRPPIALGKRWACASGRKPKPGRSRPAPMPARSGIRKGSPNSNRMSLSVMVPQTACPYFIPQTGRCASKGGARVPLRSYMPGCSRS